MKDIFGAPSDRDMTTKVSILHDFKLIFYIKI